MTRRRHQPRHAYPLELEPEEYGQLARLGALYGTKHRAILIGLGILEAGPYLEQLIHQLELHTDILDRSAIAKDAAELRRLLFPGTTSASYRCGVQIPYEDR